ncbi:hypothetical protein [Prosthecobacter sp.]|uniref:hypothetical protein n=1 Tax=Prosthecobacter sp. TaxID=1965333 RepID=UPI0037848396
MDMQVSWIDADQIKALVAQIEPQKPAGTGACGLMEIDTVPETLTDPGEKPWGFAMDWMEAPAQAVPATVETAVTAAAAAEPGLLNPEVEEVMEISPEEDEPPPPMPPAALPLSRIRDKLRAIRQRAADAGILTRATEMAPVESPPETNGNAVKRETVLAQSNRSHAAAAASVPMAVEPPQRPLFEVPAGSREVRLAAFAGWARKVLQEDGGHVLVMSDDGEVLWGGEAKAGLVLSTMMAWGAAVRASAMSACETPPLIHQTLASGNVLTVIPCDTAVGIVHAAVAAPAGLTNEQAQVLRKGLCAAMR